MKSIRYLFLTALLCNSPFSQAKKIDADDLKVCANFKENLQAGDIIFVEVNNEVFRNVSKTQNSWTNHVGMVIESEGELRAAESTIPLSKIGPLCDFIAKGSKTTVAALRPSWPLSQEDKEMLSQSAERKIGIFYHTGFDFRQDKRSFCSKFVHEVFAEVSNRHLGYEEKFRHLYESSPYPEVINFWRRWFLGRIPWERITLSPASIYKDKQLETLKFHRSPDRPIELPNYPDSYGSRD